MGERATVGIGERLHRVGVASQKILANAQARRGRGRAPFLLAQFADRVAQLTKIAKVRRDRRNNFADLDWAKRAVRYDSLSDVEVNNLET